MVAQRELSHAPAEKTTLCDEGLAQQESMARHASEGALRGLEAPRVDRFEARRRGAAHNNSRPAPAQAAFPGL